MPARKCEGMVWNSHPDAPSPQLGADAADAGVNPEGVHGDVVRGQDAGGKEQEVLLLPGEASARHLLQRVHEGAVHV